MLYIPVLESIYYEALALRNLVSHGQTLLSRRGVIACSISAPRETEDSYAWTDSNNRIEALSGITRAA